MNVKTIEISKEYNLGGNATLTAMCHSFGNGMVGDKRRGIIVVPGGGYGGVSDREAEPVALEYYNRNYNVFILKYTVAPEKIYPLVLCQLACSVDYVKRNASEFNVDKVYAVGFSAGGHLVGCIANAVGVAPSFLDGYDYKLDGVCLSYAVTDYDTHNGSFVGLLGPDHQKILKTEKWLNLTTSISEKNPPAFIWHTATDDVVDARGSMRYAMRLADLKINYELHVYREGAHGLSTMSEQINGGDVSRETNSARAWIDLSDKFFRAN